MMSFTILFLMVLSMLRQVTSIAVTSCANDPVAAAWYTLDLSLSDVSWDKYNILIYSFA
jgi:chitinase